MSPLRTSLLLLGGILVGSSLAEAPRSILLQWADQNRLDVCEVGTAALGENGARAAYGWMRDRSPANYWSLVLSSADGAWLLSEGEDDERWDEPCKRERTRSLKDPNVSVRSLAIPYRRAGSDFSTEIAIRGGRPAIITEKSFSRYGDQTLDFEHASGTRTERTEDDKRWSCRFGIITVASDDRGKLSEVPTFVTWGKMNRSSTADADLRVHAIPVGREAIRLVVTVRDDIEVAAPVDATDRTFVAADHLELWLEHPSSAELVQLGVAKTADGRVHARWLRGKRAVPAARFREGSWEIDLTEQQLGPLNGEAERRWNLTVAYSDSDDPRAGQKTIVATSQLEYNAPRSLGVLVRHRGDAPFETPTAAKPIRLISR